jgi:ubiquinone/menaquinone biosynthesis C-methylase UbiE
MQSVPRNEFQSEHNLGYVFDNREELAETRYRDLSALYDAQTIRYLEQRGIGNGWCCLEVGGGGGSIAAWLCSRVGVNGRVLATDIEPAFLQRLSFENLEVRRHDIRYEGLPEHQFDLAHARLVLMHLPGRELALRQMVKSVKRGGWIVVEEFDGSSMLANSHADPAEKDLKIVRACYQVLTARGVEMRYGRWLPQQLRACGLVNVGAEASLSMWCGYSAGTSMFRLSFKELADAILRTGLLTEAEFEADMKRLEERDFRMLSPMMWTVWGQVPETGTSDLEMLFCDRPLSFGGSDHV